MKSTEVKVIDVMSDSDQDVGELAPVMPSSQQEAESVVLRRSVANNQLPEVPHDYLEQENILRDENAKLRILNTLHLVVFMDMLGTCLMMANSMYLFFPTEGLTAEQLRRGVGIFATDSENLGIGQGLAQQLGATISTLAQAISGLLSGYLVQAVGRRGALLVYTFGGAFALALNYFTKDWGLIAYYAVRFLTGLLAGSGPVVNMYVSDMWSDPMIVQQKSMRLGGIIAIALAVGPQVGSVLGMENLFLPFLVAAALSVVGGILVIWLVPKAPAAQKKYDAKRNSQQRESEKLREENEVKAKQALEDGKVAFQKRNYKKWIAVLWIARIFDKFGGNQMMHLTTRGTRAFPVIFNNFTMIYLGISVMIFLIIPSSMKLTKMYGMAFMPVIAQTLCAVFTLCMGLAFVFADSAPLYIMFYYCSNFFNIMAMTAVTGTVITLVPKEVKNFWLGYQSAFTSFTTAICPIIVSSIVDQEQCTQCTPQPDGSIAEGTFLYVNAVCCFLSVVPYLILTRQIPRPKKNIVGVEETKEQREDADALEQWEKTKDNEVPEIRWLSFEKRRDINMARMANGKTPVNAAWRTFEEDAPELDRIKRLGRDDFKSLCDMFAMQSHQWQTGDDEYRKKFKSDRMVWLKSGTFDWKEQDRKDLGEWMGKYMEKMGWGAPSSFPRFYKMMMMTAFPEIIENGMRNPQFLDDPVPVWRRMTRVFQIVLDMDKSNQKIDDTGYGMGLVGLKNANLM